MPANDNEKSSFITLYQAYANGFWSNLYRTPQAAADVIRRHFPDARQCIVYSGLCEANGVAGALEVNFTEQFMFLHPTSIYLQAKV